MVVSPCKNVCRIEGQKCIGCNRTLDDIEKWAYLSDQEKLRVLYDTLDKS
tara:strand:+ start:1957 stop:2106 length:150 start_codon:yes stop_codon:yes gene_type:complete